jgi:hypothetical protein
MDAVRVQPWPQSRTGAETHANLIRKQEGLQEDIIAGSGGVRSVEQHRQRMGEWVRSWHWR